MPTSSTITGPDCPHPNRPLYDVIHKVADDLYLSSVRPVYTEDNLRQHRIKAVLAVTSLAPDYTHFDGIAYEHIQVDDEEMADLLSHFNDIHALLARWHNEGRSVLVHCQDGVSRGPTVVIAYLMRRARLDFLKVYSMVKSERRIIGPNSGFLKQLVLFEMLNYDINLDSIWYRRYLFDYLVHQMSTILNTRHQRAYIPTGEPMERINQLAGAKDEKPKCSYRCRSCRRVLCNDRQVLHCDGQHYYVHILVWMAEEAEYYQSSGRVRCPFCSQKIGRFNWLPPYLTTTSFLFDKPQGNSEMTISQLQVPMVFGLNRSSVDSDKLMLTQTQSAL